MTHNPPGPETLHISVSGCASFAVLLSFTLPISHAFNYFHFMCVCGSGDRAGCPLIRWSMVRSSAPRILMSVASGEMQNPKLPLTLLAVWKIDLCVNLTCNLKRFGICSPPPPHWLFPVSSSAKPRKLPFQFVCRHLKPLYHYCIVTLLSCPRSAHC